jgi:hypothetical protein
VLVTLARSNATSSESARLAPVSARARPRARRLGKSKAVAGRQGRALGDRPADPVRQKCTDPHGCPGRRDRREHQGVGLDDAGAGRRGRRADCGPREGALHDIAFDASPEPVRVDDQPAIMRDGEPCAPRPYRCGGRFRPRRRSRPRHPRAGHRRSRGRSVYRHCGRAAATAADPIARARPPL